MPLALPDQTTALAVALGLHPVLQLGLGAGAEDAIAKALSGSTAGLPLLLQVGYC